MIPKLLLPSGITRDLQKLLILGSHPQHSDLIGVRGDLGIGTFKSSSGDSNVQQSLGTTGLRSQMTC